LRSMRAYILLMPTGLKRYYGAGHAHFITCGCFHREPWLDTAARRDLFLTILEEARQRFRFIVLGYVVMPDHFHLLISEPQVGDPSKVMQLIKQLYAQRVVLRTRRKRDSSQTPSLKSAPMHIWETRFYDFNVWTEYKRVEKLRYMHRNPVKSGLVSEPQDWVWSSFRDYFFGQTGIVRVNDTDIMIMRVRPPAA